MNTFGNRLLALRREHNLTQDALAERIGCSKIMVQRYEKDSHFPSAQILAKIAVLFDVSSDYLLGLVDEDKKEINQQAHLAKINKVLNNKPIEGVEYYWIELMPDKMKNEVDWGGQTMWIGWSDDDEYELRTLRPIKPDGAIQYCTEMFGQPMVVNDIDDLGVLIQFGGQAIIKTSIVEEYLPVLLEPMAVKRERLNELLTNDELET